VIIIDSECSTPRFLWTCKVIFTHVLGADFQIINSNGTLFSHISYGKVLNKAKIHIPKIENANILFGDILEDIEINIDNRGEFPIIFECFEYGAIDFDIFAAVFYLTSRYEEYISTNKDKFGRFSHEESLSFRYDFLEIPIVDIWIDSLWKKLLAEFPNLNKENKTFSIRSTIDIDLAFAYKNKSVSRQLKSIAKKILHFQIKYLFENLLVIWGIKKDPYDVYDFLKLEHQNRNIKPKFFILSGYENNAIDNQLNIDNKKVSALLQFLKDFATIGIHPSSKTRNNPIVLQNEINRLSNILNIEISDSRQHYILLDFPQTYQSLSRAKICDDFSMGYASHIGFRAGLSVPYPFFDLIENKESNLMIHPFCVMDGALKNYMNLSIEESLDIINTMKNRLKQVNGCFSFVWHNSSFSSIGEWNGWERVYLALLSIT